MKKLTSNEGFTFVEMLVTVLILVFLVLGIGTGMDSALSIYDEARFEANSATAADIVNTSLGDVLRYAEVTLLEEGEKNFVDSTNTKVPDIKFVFTNYDYGLKDAYFTLDAAVEQQSGVIRLKTLNDSSVVELVNEGSYPNLEVKNFKITFHQRDDVESGSAEDVYGAVTGPGIYGAYFTISYTIQSTKDAALTREVTHVVRCMNEL